MIRLLAQYETTIEGKTFKALMDYDTSIPIAKEMAFSLLTHLGNVQAQEQAKAEKDKLDAEAKTSEEAKPDEIPPTEEKNVE